jgi:hypothetical protein
MSKIQMEMESGLKLVIMYNCLMARRLRICKDKYSLELIPLHNISSILQSTKPLKATCMIFCLGLSRKQVSLKM